MSTKAKTPNTEPLPEHVAVPGYIITTPVDLVAALNDVAPGIGRGWQDLVWLTSDKDAVPMVRTGCESMIFRRSVPASKVVPKDRCPQVAVPFRAVMRFLKSLPKDGTLRLEVGVKGDEPIYGIARLTCGNVNLELVGRSPANLTTDPPVRAWQVQLLSADDVAAIRRVGIAASDDEGRPILCGVLVDGDTAVATDAYRLAYGRTSTPADRLAAYPNTTDPAWAFHVPTYALRHLPTGPLELHIGRGVGEWATVLAWSPNPESDHFHSVTVLPWTFPAESFPAWRDKVPASSPPTIRADRKALTAAAAMLKKFATGDYSPVIITLKDSEAVMTRRVQDHGTLEVRVPVDVDGATLVRVAFAPDYLLDALAFGTGDLVRIGVTSALKPVTFPGTNPDEGYILMPVRIDSNEG